MMSIGNTDPGSFVRDWNLLESTLARPQHAANYEDAGPPRQAATLLWGLVRNHPFIDGNKRIAHLTALTFLEVNGFTLVATGDASFQLMLEVATGLPIDDVARWIQEHLSS